MSQQSGAPCVLPFCVPTQNTINTPSVSRLLQASPVFQKRTRSTIYTHARCARLFVGWHASDVLFEAGLGIAVYRQAECVVRLQQPQSAAAALQVHLFLSCAARRRS